MATPLQRQIMIMRRQSAGLGQYDVELLEEKRQELARIKAELASVQAETARLQAVERGEAPGVQTGIVQQAREAAARIPTTAWIGAAAFAALLYFKRK